MKFALALAAAIIATPAMSKTWADVSCSMAFISENDAFTLVKDGSEGVSCAIDSWPIAQAEAKLSCADGSTPSLSVLSDDKIVVDGVELILVTDDGPICD